METDLFNNQNKNILTYLSYFNAISEKAENYYLFIQSYKKYTSEYFDKISNLFKKYSSLFNINNTSNSNNNNSTNPDTSPLDKLTKDLYQDFKEQLNVFNFF